MDKKNTGIKDNKEEKMILAHVGPDMEPNDWMPTQCSSFPPIRVVLLA